MIKELRILNEMFLINDKNGKKIDGKSFIYHKGREKIIISAPHAVKQVREGIVKKSDYLTGSLAIYLAEKMNCSYFVRVCNTGDDPNYPIGKTIPNIENEYLKALCKVLEKDPYFLLIDLHGSSDHREYDCNIWSDNCNSCDNDIINIFQESYQKNGLTSNSSNEFVGGQVTRQAMSYTNAFQLEVKKRLRSFKNEELLKRFINSTEEAINKVYNLKR